MKLIIGLGNPGEQYGKTRHNTGWRALNFLAGKTDWQGQNKFKALVATAKIAGTKVILAKPETFMNNSGLAASQLKNFYKIKKEDILIIYDDLDLPLGTLRLRAGGSAGGHQGLASVLGGLTSESVARLKIGVAEGRPGIQKIPSEEYVLKNFSRKGEKTLAKVLRQVPEIVERWLKGKIIDTTFNIK